MPRTPDVTVAAVTETAGRFLVVEERINHRLVLNQPAGRFEPTALLGVYLWRNPASGRRTLRFAFTGAVADHDAGQKLDRGIVGTHWLSPLELEARATRLRSPLVLRCVHDYLTGQRLALEPLAGLDLHAASAASADVVTL